MSRRHHTHLLAISVSLVMNFVNSALWGSATLLPMALFILDATPAGAGVVAANFGSGVLHRWASSGCWSARQGRHHHWFRWNFAERGRLPQHHRQCLLDRWCLRMHLLHWRPFKPAHRVGPRPRRGP